MYKLVSMLARIGPGLSAGYRQVRLKALKTDPSAFGSAYERELELTPEDWKRRTMSLDGRDRIGFFAMKSDSPCALAICFRDEDDPQSGQILSLWVDPAERRRGLALKLLESVRGWALERGMTKLRLLVTSSNLSAIAAYQRAGFAETGNMQSHPNDLRVLQIEMARATALPISQTAVG